MARIEKIHLEQYNPLKLDSVGEADVFVVDMINGFCKEGNMADSNIMKITPNIKKLLEAFTNTYHKEAFFFVDAHKEDAIEFTSFPKHCIQGTLECEIVDDLLPYVKKENIIYKNSTNGFHEILAYLENIKVNKKLQQIIVTGCCTDICVMQFALTLKTWLNAQDLNIDVILPVDCVDTYDSENSYHNAEQFNYTALTIMEQAGIKIFSKII